jgi:hypothetical protein
MRFDQCEINGFPITFIQVYRLPFGFIQLQPLGIVPIASGVL